jgi:hypothetical protein
MATLIDTPAVPNGATFDASAWFADWTDHGGIAINTGERLFVGRLAAIDREASLRLDALREALLQRHGGMALAAHLAARAAGEARP